MTLVVGVYAKDAIVLASDSLIMRPEDGSYTEEARDKQKLWPFGRCAVGVAGYEALTDDFVRLLQSPTVAARAVDVNEAKLVAHQALFDGWHQRFPGTPPRNIRTGFMVAGFEADGKTPRIYCLLSGDDFLGGISRANAVGSPTACRSVEVIRRLLFGQLDAPALPLEDAKQFAVLALFVGRETDVMVGGPTQLALVTPDRYVDLTREVPELERYSQRLIDRLRKLFLPRSDV
jgi:20S proteasome alpha/beta subunit